MSMVSLRKIWVLPIGEDEQALRARRRKNATWRAAAKAKPRARCVSPEAELLRNWNASTGNTARARSQGA